MSTTDILDNFNINVDLLEVKNIQFSQKQKLIDEVNVHVFK